MYIYCRGQNNIWNNILKIYRRKGVNLAEAVLAYTVQLHFAEEAAIRCTSCQNRQGVHLAKKRQGVYLAKRLTRCTSCEKTDKVYILRKGRQGVHILQRRRTRELTASVTVEVMGRQSDLLPERGQCVTKGTSDQHSSIFLLILFSCRNSSIPTLEIHSFMVINSG